MTTFAIRTNCRLLITKRYFRNSWRNPKYDGDAKMWIEVQRHSYGKDKGQHTFTCRVLEIVESNSKKTHKVGDTFRIKGRNLYPDVIDHQQGAESIAESF